MKSDQYPKDLKIGVGYLLDLIDCFQEVVSALETKIRRLDGDKNMGGGNKRVERDQPKGGRSIDDEMVIFGADRFENILKAKVAINFPKERRLKLSHGDLRNRDIQAGNGGLSNNALERFIGMHKDVIKRFRVANRII
jgi:hypothetical protein